MLDLQKKLDAPTLLLLGGIVFWIALYAFIGPQPAGVDAFYFKDAGINFATGKGFKEIVTPGNPTLEYKYYATYPPVYPFLYGLYAFVFGVGDYQNTYFNLLLQIIRAVLLFIIVVKYGTDWTPNQKMIITGILILILPSAHSYDRPEDLVMVLFLMSLLFYLRRQHKIAFLVAGLNLTTSPVLGLMSAVILSGMYFHDIFKEKVEWKGFVEKSYPVLYAIVFPIIIIAILALLDLSIFERFYNFMKYMSDKGSPIVVDYIKGFLSGSVLHHGMLFFSFLVILIAHLLMFFYSYRIKEKRTAFFMIGVIIVVTALYLQARRNYYTFLTAFSILVGMYVMMRNVESVRESGKKVFLVCLGIMFLAIFPKVARDIYLRAVPMNRENYELSKQSVQNFLKDKDGDLCMVSKSSLQHYFIVKISSVLTVVNYEYLSKEFKLPRYIVQCPNQDSVISFKPDLQMYRPEVEKTYLYRKVFETEKSVPNPQNTFWERLLMRPHETWYPVIYERIDEQQTHIP